MSDEELTSLLRKGQHLYGRCLQKQDTRCVLGFVNHQQQSAQGQAVIRAYLEWLVAQHAAHVAAQRQPEAELTASLIAAMPAVEAHRSCP